MVVISMIAECSGWEKTRFHLEPAVF